MGNLDNDEDLEAFAEECAAAIDKSLEEEAAGGVSLWADTFDFALIEALFEEFFSKMQKTSAQPSLLSGDDPPVEKTPIAASARSFFAGQPLHQEDVKEGENHG